MLKLSIQFFGGRGAASASSSATTTPTITANVGNWANMPFSMMSDADAAQLRDDMDGNYEPDVVNAIKMYISAADANGDGFSYSQNLNYKLDNGKPLDVNEKYIDAFMQQGMHEIGKNTNLFRACHDDVLQSLGISDYSKLTESQLQSKLVGATFTSKAYMSASYDAKKNPFTNPSSGVSGGREVYMNIKAKGNTKIVFGAKSQAEMVINKGTNFKITGIHYDGTYATPRNKGYKPRVVIDIETE